MEHIKLSSYALLAMIGLAFTACDLVEDADDLLNESSKELPCDYFSSGENRILTDDPDEAVDYIISCRTFVNTDLVIEPGVVIEFQDNAGLEIGEAGSISAVGTKEKPITFTGVTKTAGAWSGVLVESNDIKNELRYVNVSYGGGEAFNSNGNRANLILWADTRLSIDDCTFSHSASYGIEMDYQNYTIPSFTNNTLTDNETPIYTQPAIVHVFDASSQYSGNTNDHIVIGCAELTTGDYTWNKLDVPFRVVATGFGIRRWTEVPDQCNLVLVPGVIIEFDTDTGLRINKGGSLKARGTNSDNILFTGVDQGTGAWRGIYFNFTQSINNQLNKCIIEYAGSGDDKAGVLMWANPKVIVTNTIFKDIDGCGFLDMPESTGVFDNPNLNESNNTFQNISGGNFCAD
ncbi:MAG: hypothetical protein AAF847_06445 [Bacteroidota bacterium]